MYGLKPTAFNFDFFAISPGICFFATSCHLGSAQDLTPLYPVVHQTFSSSWPQTLAARPQHPLTKRFVVRRGCQLQADFVISRGHLFLATSCQMGCAKDLTPLWLEPHDTQIGHGVSPMFLQYPTGICCSQHLAARVLLEICHPSIV